MVMYPFSGLVYLVSVFAQDLSFDFFSLCFGGQYCERLKQGG